MDFRTDAQKVADRERRQVEEQSNAGLLNRAVIAADRLDAPAATCAALSSLFVNWARIPRSAPSDVLDLARAVVADAGGA